MSKGSSSSQATTLTPPICVVCGQPAKEYKQPDAREESSRYFLLGRLEKGSYGAIYIIPYCKSYSPDADYFARKFRNYQITEIVGNALVILTILTLSAILIPSDLTNCILLRLFFGILIAGVVLFAFTPLFSLITGLIFPSTLDQDRRKDFSHHLKAQKGGNPFTGNLPYLPGISVDHILPHRGNLPINSTMLVTNPTFAEKAHLLTVGEILLEREKRKKTIKKTPDNLVKFCSYYKFHVEIRKHPDYQTPVCDKSLEGSNNKNPCTQDFLRNQNYIHQLETIFWKQNLTEDAVLNYEKLFKYYDYTSL
jgi:hypothetical protein